MANRLASLVAIVSLWLVVPSTSQAQNSGLTPELMNRMVKLAADKGGNKVINAVIATSLGLTVNQDWSSRGLAANDRSGNIHTYDLSRGNDKEFLVYVQPPGGAVQVFHSRSDGVLVRAITILPDGEIKVRNVAEAQKDFEAEIDYWARSVDLLRQRGVPPPAK